MTEDVADTGLRNRRETQRERVARSLMPYTRHELEAAAAAIAAYPDPRVTKDRGAPPSPNDYCRLHAMRHEFEALVACIETEGAVGLPQAVMIARALREQGVVR